MGGDRAKTFTCKHTISKTLVKTPKCHFKLGGGNAWLPPVKDALNVLGTWTKGTIKPHITGKSL